ncbi:methyl-accepting chemotaxis protein [Pseudomonas sp. R3.Fl]|nr:methyl-accepting chemotaxis protein [Pseudomonas sp. R3.Fl]MCL6692963.1 methyl-accepting chemotaxis protein [Pseudomonas sp. R3.Fl]
MPVLRLSAQWRISVLSGCCLLAVVASLLGATLYQAQRNASLLERESTRLLSEAAHAHLQASATLQGLRVERFLDETRLYAEGFAKQLLQLREQALVGQLPSEALRRQIVSRTHEALREKPQLLGMYVVLQANALDDQDSRFVDQPAAAGNETGRFALYWSQSKPGQLVQAVLNETNITANHAPPGSEAENAWFTCPLQSGQACVVEPYAVEVEGRKTLMSSIALPLVQDGKTLGVVGIDISLSTLQKMSETLSASLYQGQGEVSILSAGGLLVGHSSDPEGLGKALAADADSTEAIDIRQPLQVPAARPWTLQIRVPQAVLQAPALQLQAQLNRQNLQATWMSLGLGVLASGAGLLLIWFAARGVTRPLLQVADMLDAIVDGDGDLTQRLPNSRGDEIGRLASGFNRFLDKLQPIIGEIQKAALHTRETADRSALIAAQVNDGMQRQHQEVEQAATALHQMSVSSQDVAHSSSRTAQAATAAEEASRKGLVVFGKSADSIAALDRGLERTLADVRALAHSSSQIGQVLDVICSIAEQTNLLALNAAIEAARAGEQGRGFAVVADEVRQLASHTQNSVGEIREVVETLQQLSEQVTGSMRLSREQANQSVALVDESHAALRTIGDAVEVIDSMTQQIASAAVQQSSASEEISRRVSGIRDISETLIAQVEESSRIGRSLHDMANQQQRLVEHFKT